MLEHSRGYHRQMGKTVPWHRVFNCDACVAVLPDPDDRRAQTDRLRSNGVEIANEGIRMAGLARRS